MGQRAVVTGANSGIGLATSLRLAADGHEVFAGARRDEGLAEISDAAATAGVTLHPVRIDVTDDRSVDEAFAEVLDGGPVGILVNNAGITGAGSVEETPVSVYQQMFDTNVAGVVRCTQKVLPGMRGAGTGRIVNMSSSSATISPPMMSAYASTKFAVESISESLQAEVAAFGIRVVIVRAGTILTPIWAKNEAPPEDTAYPDARDFLLAVLTHQLTRSGVPPDEVAATISAAVSHPEPALRHVVGDAEVLARMRESHDDAALFGVHFLGGEEFRIRYSELSGVDYWT